MLGKPLQPVPYSLVWAMPSLFGSVQGQVCDADCSGLTLSRSLPPEARARLALALIAVLPLAPRIVGQAGSPDERFCEIGDDSLMLRAGMRAAGRGLRRGRMPVL